MAFIFQKDELQRAISIFFDHIGCSYPRSIVRVYEGAHDRPERTINVAVHWNLNIEDVRSSDDLVQVFKDNVMEQIKTSPLFQKEMAIRNSEIKELKVQLGESQQKVLGLEKYHTHYELEMSLRHGYPDVIVAPEMPK